MPSWKAKCKVGVHTFVLTFDSQTGDAYADDMQVRLKAAGETRVAPLPEKLYRPTKATSDSTSVCDSTAALMLDSDAAMVFVTVDHRPGIPFVISVVVDAKDRRVFIPQALGYTTSALEVRSTFVRMYASQARDAKAKNSDGSDGFVFAWRRFALVGRDIRARWETPAPKGAKPVSPPVLVNR
ncbi:MAG: hypothetical protein ACAI38_21435 [Myxococcota bacterium]|nr:hypothetical protein [Myxococcota bacterium]